MQNEKRIVIDSETWQQLNDTTYDCKYIGPIIENINIGDNIIVVDEENENNICIEIIKDITIVEDMQHLILGN